VSWHANPDVAYSYAPGNKRIWRGAWDSNSGTQTVDELTFWSVNGQKLVTYQLSISGSSLVATATGTNQYFGGKLVKNTGGYVTPDRLGSIGKYFPYGQERPSATTDGKEKFATYFRDSETGLDYANARYHQPGMGRFMTPDSVPANSKDPASWNRYSYVEGDPINYFDPRGRFQQAPGTPGADDGGGDDPGKTQFLYGDDIPSTWWEANCQEFGQSCPGGGGGGAQFNSIQPGRYAPPGLLGVLTGYGPSLHVVGGSSGLDPNALPFTNSNIGSVYSDAFTVHIDSAWADNPIGAILHGIFDVLGSSTRNPCP
jgi:RHS repeat-associated protein